MDEIIAARAPHGMTPTSADVASKPPTPSFKPVALRSPAPVDLREAAAAATAEPVVGLDPNYDTPDVRAVVAEDTATAGAGGCVSYRTIRWHGHLHRRAFTRSCAAKPNAAAPVVAYAPAPPSLVPPAFPLPSSAPATVSTIKPVASAAASAAARPALPVVHFGEADDRAAAAARVSSMAAPVLLDSRKSSTEETAAPAPALKQLFAAGSNPFTTAASNSGTAAPATGPQP